MRTSMFGRVGLIAAIGAVSGLVAAAQPLTGATSIAVGTEHACATLQGGGAACWGTAQGSTAGDVLSRPSSGRAAGPVGGLNATLTRIGVGFGHACALSVAGEVWCWGDDIVGQLGNGTAINAPSGPARVPGLTDATAVAAAASHSCAVSAGGAFCWGHGGQGQLGNGAFGNSQVPVAVSGLASGVQQIVAGGLTFGGFSCAIAGGAASCWGNGSDGQLGNGTGLGSGSPAAVVGLGSDVTAIAAGTAHACAVQSGVVKCWGDNTFGQLGDGTLEDRLAPVTVLDVGGTAVTVAAGRSHSCALRVDGSALCWGANFVGQLGDGTTNLRTSAAPVVGLGGSAVAIAAGMDTTCALIASGEVRCFGSNGRDQLGLNFQPNHFVPIAVAPVAGGFAAIEGGRSHTCAVGASGGAWCFGAGAHGQLGTGLRRHEALPTQVATLGSGVAEVTSGTTHSCARTSAGAALCWGEGTWGNLGNGSTAPALTPVSVSGLASGVASISAAGQFTCAATSAGGVKCWGSNGDGVLGVGMIMSSSVPVDVPDLDGVQRVTTGLAHVCVLRNGGVKCWGSNGSVQLGDGTNVSRPTPGDVLGLTAGVTSVQAGLLHTCAIAGGEVRCWGDNGRGQLGDGTTTSRPYAITVGGLPAVPVAVAAGDVHSCAIVADGAVWCWGMNEYGQVGPNWGVSFTNPATRPVHVPLGEPASAIAAGGSHTCAILGGGRAQCWGAATESQLGNGEARYSPVPRAVLVGDFATTTEVTTTPSPSVEPENVTITVRVRASETVPTGAVAFYDGEQQLDCGPFPGTALLSLGAATCTKPMLRGLHALRAEYVGDRVNLPSSGTTAHQVLVSAGEHCVGFDDVDAADPLCRSVEWMRNRSITQGCSTYGFCPVASVSRLAMAAFMDRLGGVLTPEVVSAEQNGGTVVLAGTSLQCPSPQVAAAPYPRLAIVDAALSAANAGGEVEYRLVRRFGSDTDLTGSPLRVSLAATGAHAAARIAGSFLIPAGTRPRFGVQARGIAGLLQIADLRCTLRAAIVSGEDTHAPFDASSGGTP